MADDALTWLLALALLGGGGLATGFAFRSSVSLATFTRWRKRHVGVAAFLLYLLAITLWGVFGSCGDDCAIDPAPLYAYSFLQIPGWFIGIWAAGQLARSRHAEG
jgi:hypothetical protein